MAATIIVIEDDDPYRYAVEKHLTSRGFLVRAHPEPMAALDALKAGAHADFALIDVRLGENKPHGVSAALMLHYAAPNLSIAFMTAYPEYLDGRITGRIGPIFSKPIDLDWLIEHFFVQPAPPSK